MIKIKSCSDPYMWYHGHEGRLYNIVREYEGDYLVRDSGGYLNIVLKADAVRIIDGGRHGLS